MLSHTANWHESCDCCVGWTGEYCETNVDECASSESNLLPLCHHGGVCADTPGSYRCICLSTGYTGMLSDLFILLMIVVVSDSRVYCIYALTLLFRFVYR